MSPDYLLIVAHNCGWRVVGERLSRGKPYPILGYRNERFEIKAQHYRWQRWRLKAELNAISHSADRAHRARFNLIKGGRPEFLPVRISEAKLSLVS